MLRVIETEKTVQEVEALFPQICSKHKFGVLGVHNLRQKMNEKGVPFEKDCLIFEVCNPQKAKTVLENNLEISAALPCRVSVYRDGKRTKIATIKPTSLIDLFATPSLKEVAEDVESELFQIMDEIAAQPMASARKDHAGTV